MITFNDVSLVYPNGTQGLKDINLTINKGEFVVIVGLSGAGKSTFIRSINRMVSPTEGKLIVDGENALDLTGKKLRQLRTKIGMIFQNYNLVNRSSVMKNTISGRLGHTGTFRSVFNLFAKNDRAMAYENLKRVNIEDRLYNRADQLSGGQQQRVSIARVLTQEPKIILADEPVASLDPPTARQVMNYLKKINQEDNITTIVNLHSVEMAKEYADRIIGMRSGEVVFDDYIENVNNETFNKIYDRPAYETDLEGSETDESAAN